MLTFRKISGGVRLAVLVAFSWPTADLAADTVHGPGRIQCQAAAPAGPQGSEADDVAFMAANKPVMDRMMADMEITSSHDVDRDFTAMMIPHHQGAIDMAVLELRYGRNEQLRRIAQEIIVDQQQEIVVMRMALGQSLPPPTPAPTGSAPMQMPMTH